MKSVKKSMLQRKAVHPSRWPTHRQRYWFGMLTKAFIRDLNVILFCACTCMWTSQKQKCSTFQCWQNKHSWFSVFSTASGALALIWWHLKKRQFHNNLTEGRRTLKWNLSFCRRLRQNSPIAAVLCNNGHNWTTQESLYKRETQMTWRREQGGLNTQVNKTEVKPIRQSEAKTQEAKLDWTQA